jgi:tetratricopeptide (TPR) repeat protein
MTQLTRAALVALVVAAAAAPAAAQSCTDQPTGRNARDARDRMARALIARDGDKEKFYTEALERLGRADAETPNNPVLIQMRGDIAAARGNVTQADSAWKAAEAACPELAGEIAAARQGVWASQLQAGVAKYTAGDTTGAIAMMEAANALYDKRGDIFFNLGVIYGQRGDLARSVQNYRQALAAVERTPEDTTPELISSKRDMKIGALSGLLNAGAQLFSQDKFAEAGELFGSVLTAVPNHRDALYNQALVLYKQENWTGLIPLTQRLLSVDPLNENAAIILFNAHKGIADAGGNTPAATASRNEALKALEAADAMSVKVESVQLANGEGSTVVRGTVEGGKAAAGSPVQLEFTLHGVSGPLGTGTVTIAAPAKDTKANFEVTIPTSESAISFSYRKL